MRSRGMFGVKSGLIYNFGDEIYGKKPFRVKSRFRMMSEMNGKNRGSHSVRVTRHEPQATPRNPGFQYLAGTICSVSPELM